MVNTFQVKHFLLVILLLSILVPCGSSQAETTPGTILWDTGGVPGVTWSTPIVIGQKIFQQDQDGGIYCFRKSDGEQLWHKQLAEAWPTKSPVYRNGKLFVIAGDTIFRLDPECGNIEKEYKATASLSCMAPAVSETTVYVSTSDTLIALDRETFEVSWTKTIPSSNVIVNGEVVYALSDKLYALNPVDGNEIWTLDSPVGKNFQMGALSDDIIVAITGPDGSNDIQTRVHTFKMSTDQGVPPTKIWSADVGTKWADNAPPAIDLLTGMVYVSSRDGILKAFSLDGDGTPAWTKPVRGSGFASALPAAVDGKVFIQIDLPENKTLACLNGSTGTTIWETPHPQGEGWPISWGSPVIDDNIVYFAFDHEGGIFAIDGGEIDGSWYMIKQNPDLTGRTGDWEKTIINLPSTLGLAQDNNSTAFAFSEKPPEKIGLPDYQVNTATLNLVLEGTLFWMKTKGHPISLGLTYNADHTLPGGMFGEGWRMGYETNIDIGCNGKSVKLRKGSGQVLTFESKTDLTLPDLSYPIQVIPPKDNFDRMKVYADYIEWWKKSTKTTYKYTKPTGGGLHKYYLTEFKDNNNNTVTLDVNLENGLIKSIKGPSGRQITFTFDEVNNLCTRINTPSLDTRHMDFEYDNNNCLTQITDMAGYKAKYEYDEDLYLDKIIAENDSQTVFEYASRGSAMGKYVRKVKNSETGWSRYEILNRDPFEIKRITSVGKTRTYSSRNGKTGRVEDGMGNSSRIIYKDELPARFIDRRGNSRHQYYDNNGNITSQYDEVGNITRFTYDSDGNMTTNTTALGEVYRYTYDSSGNQIKITYPDNSFTAKGYNTAGQMMSITDPNNNVTQYQYDTKGNMIKIIDTNGGETLYSYPGAGLRCTQITDPRNNVKNLTYDKNDRLSKVYLGDILQNHFVDYGFDSVGQIFFQDEKGNKTQVTRNPMGYITRKTMPEGNITDYLYDLDNNLVKTTSPLGRISYREYNANEKLVKETDAVGNKVANEYDNEENLISVTDRKGNISRFEYDDASRMVKRIDPAGIQTIMAYDARNRVSQITTGTGDLVSFTYDYEGRKKTVSHNGSQIDSFEYDNAGNITRMTDISGTTSYIYTEMNKVQRINYPQGETVDFEYDLSGNITRIVTPGGVEVLYTYDNINRVEIPRALRSGTNVALDVAMPNTNKVTGISFLNKTISMDYDLTSMPVRIDRPNGISSYFEYDKNKRTTRLHHNFKATDDLDMSLGYNIEDMLTSKTGGFDFKPVTQDQAINGTYNSSNQILTWGEKDCTYDVNGNLTTVGQDFSFGYDLENKLTMFSHAPNQVSGSFTYNALGQRVKQVVNGVTRYFYYDRADRLLFDANGEGIVQNVYIYAAKKPIALFRVSDQKVFYYHYGLNGNTLALTDDTGGITTKYAYTPFGEVRQAGVILENPFTFVGGYGVVDVASGLFCMKQRFYDASVKRFLQRDPMGFDASTNLYMYADNNPVKYVDPDGAAPWGFITSKITNFFQKKKGETKKESSARRIVNSLVGGIVTGASTGAVAGSVIPGAGTVAGGFIGATMGAAGGITTGVAMEITGIGEQIESIAGSVMDTVSSIWSEVKAKTPFETDDD
jgi:RHS repeat-associated protein